MPKIKPSTTVILIEAIAIIALVIVLALSGKVPSEKMMAALTPQKAAKVAIDYINENFLSEQEKMTLDNVEEISGIYKVKVKVGENEDIIFITKDGRFLWQRPVDLQPPEPKEFPKTTKPDVKLFVMSYCPFGNQAEEIMMPVAELLQDKASIELHYIVSEEQEGKFSSLHGDQELHQDIRELCVQKYQRDKLWDFVKAINAGANAKNVNEKWEVIAQGAGINVEQIRTCQEQEGNTLLAKELTLTNKNYPVQDPSKLPPPLTGKEEIKPSSFPTLVVNGMVYTGSRGVNDYKEGVCSAFISPPAECEQVLEETAGDVTGSCQ